MVQFLARTDDGQHFTLSINGERRTYANDKEGKRQAILDGLEAIETVAVGRDVFLSSNAALQAVAAVLYPDGIRTEEAYQLVCRVTEKACAHVGYGAEVELGPPIVSFTARGAYRKRYPPIDPQLVLDELELAGISSYHPRREANRRGLWNKVAWNIYGKPWSGLTEAQQTPIQAKVDAIAAGAGWQRDGDSAEDGGADDGSAANNSGADLYTRALEVNAAGARQQLVQYLRDAGGRPLPVRAVLAQAQSGAYGRAFYHDDLAPELATIVADVLQAHGYRAEPEAGEYRPAPVAAPAGGTQSLTTALESLPTVDTDFGPALLLRDMLAAVRPILGVETISEWQAEQLLENGVLGEALGRLGYRRRATWCQPFRFRPRLDDPRARQVILKEIRITRDPERRLSLADGLPVYAPAVVLDPEEDEIVYLEVVGAKQAVRANWAALVGGGSGGRSRVHWFGRQRIELDGMKNHRLVQAALPCGWSDYILIHKQASLQAMNPEEPFYLLDDGSRQIPALFYAMLNKCLAIPLLEAWADYLWTKGREEKLIALLNDGAGQGYAAWRVLPAPDEWRAVVRDALAREEISLGVAPHLRAGNPEAGREVKETPELGYNRHQAQTQKRSVWP